jgi:DNA-directed RNA polymerase specialized sigma24 family protein
MNQAIERVIEYVERYTQAGENLIERLQAQRTWNLEDIERLRNGMTLGQSTKATNSAERSRELTRILAEFEQSRREIRAAVVAAALDEGMTISEIADIFGVSRQLANRFVKDARGLSDQPGSVDAVGSASPGDQTD